MIQTRCATGPSRGVDEIGLFLLVALLGPASASAGVAIQVLETDPMSPAVLGHWESFYLRIGYETDRPIRVRGEALFEGKPVTSMTSGAPLHQAGTGDAMFWFAYTTPARVDRIRVWAEDERTRQRLAQSEISVDLTWTGQRTEAVRRPPEWVERFKAEQERRAREDAAAYRDRPTSWLEVGVFFAAMWSIPIYFVLQIVALWRFSGGWPSFNQYHDVLGTAAYLRRLGISIGMAFVIAAAATVLAYPIAYFLAFRARGRATVYLILLLIPFASSYLLRVMAWKLLLGRQVRPQEVGQLETHPPDLGQPLAPTRAHALTGLHQRRARGIYLPVFGGPAVEVGGVGALEPPMPSQRREDHLIFAFVMHDEESPIEAHVLAVGFCVEALVPINESDEALQIGKGELDTRRIETAGDGDPAPRHDSADRVRRLRRRAVLPRADPPDGRRLCVVRDRLARVQGRHSVRVGLFLAAARGSRRPDSALSQRHAGAGDHP